jgi:hypothetical protein
VADFTRLVVYMYINSQCLNCSCKYVVDVRTLVQSCIDWMKVETDKTTEYIQYVTLVVKRKIVVPGTDEKRVPFFSS